jgi:hypothetical protein
LPTSRQDVVLIDDRLLVAHLLGAWRPRRRRTALHSTIYWYYRASRAAVAGGAGQLSGPFAALGPDEQAAAIRAILALPEDIGLPDPRTLVPKMVDLHARHRVLNLLNLEAVASALLLGARVLLSTQASSGVLPGVLEAEGVDWESVALS